MARTRRGGRGRGGKGTILEAVTAPSAPARPVPGPPSGGRKPLTARKPARRGPAFWDEEPTSSHVSLTQSTRDELALARPINQPLTEEQARWLLSRLEVDDSFMAVDLRRQLATRLERREGLAQRVAGAA